MVKPNGWFMKFIMVSAVKRSLKKRARSDVFANRH